MKINSIRQRKGELKTKRRDGQKSNVWKIFGDVVKDNDSSDGYVMCDDCEALYKFDSHNTGLQIGLWHVKVYCLDGLNGN